MAQRQPSLAAQAPTLTSLTRSRQAAAAKFGGTLLAPVARRVHAHPLPSCADQHGYYTRAMTGFSGAARAATRARYTSALIQERKAWGLLGKSGLARPARRRSHPKPAPAPATPAPPAAQPSTAAPSPQGCYPLSDEGTCYEPGECCRDSDQGVTGVAGDGESIICEDNDGLRWEPAG